MILEFDPDYIQEAEEFGVEIKKVIARNGHHIKIETWCRKEYVNLSTQRKLIQFWATILIQILPMLHFLGKKMELISLRIWNIPLT